jgi:hypothetical protein
MVYIPVTESVPTMEMNAPSKDTWHTPYFCGTAASGRLALTMVEVVPSPVSTVLPSLAGCPSFLFCLPRNIGHGEKTVVIVRS